MKTTFVIGALAATVGVGSATYMLVSESEDQAEKERRPRADKAKRATTRAQPEAEDRSDWEAEERIAELENEVATLQRQVRALQLRAGASAVGSSDNSGDEPVELDDPAVAESVRAIVAEEREREREQEMERRRTRAQERTDEALDELAAQANINGTQREKIGNLWNEERDQMFALFDEARGGDRDFREVREQARQLRQQTDEQAKAVLSDEQYTVYEDVRPRGPGGRGGRGGEGGGGGPRGRPGADDGP